MPVVDNANLNDSVQLVAPELDFYLVRISVQRVPNQLDQAGERFGGAEPLKVLLVEFDVEIHSG
jgi:hypothetical protein